MKHSNVKSSRAFSALIGGENNKVHVRGATSIVGFIKYCFSDSGNRTHRFLLLLMVGALITIVNIAAYLHYSTAFGNGGVGFKDGGDGDGLADGAHEFIEAHKNKKIFSAHQQKEGDSSPSEERRVRQDEKEEGNRKKEKHVKSGNRRGEEKDEKGNLVEAPPATNRNSSSRRRRKKGEHGPHDLLSGDRKKKALSAPPAIFLDPKENNVISVDHDRNEVQSAHLVASLGGSLGGGNGKPHKRLPYPSASSSSSSSGGRISNIKLPGQWGIGNGQQPTERSAVPAKKIKVTEGDHGNGVKNKDEGGKEQVGTKDVESGRERAPVDDKRTVADDKKSPRDEKDEKDRDNDEEETKRKEKRRQRKHKAAAAQKENDEEEGEEKRVSDAGAAGGEGNDDHNDEDASERRRHKKKRRGKNDSHIKKKKNKKRAMENGDVEEEKEDNNKVPHINVATSSSSSSFPVVELGASNNSLARDFTKARLSFDASVSTYYEHQKEAISGGVEQSSNRFTDIHEAPGNGVLLPTGTRRDLEERFGLRSQEGRDAKRAEKKSAGDNHNGDDPELDDPAQPALENKAARGPGNPNPQYISQRLGNASNNKKKNTEVEADSSHDPSFSAAYCDPTNADFTPESDAACMSYLTDIRNMQSIKVMSSVLSTGRTIKMKVFYRHNNVEAVLKVSQKKFQLEPVSEVIAFHTDRVLGFNRVPPAVWTPIPLDFLRAAAAQVSSFYSQWLQQFAIDYDTSKPLISKCFLPADGKTGHRRQSQEGEHGPLPPHSGQCLNVSLQLWLFDVHDAEDTKISPPRRYRHLLNVPFPDDDEEGKAGKERRGGGVIVRKRGKAVQHGFAAENALNSNVAINEDNKAASAIITSSERSLIEDPYLRIAVSELMDQFVFDYVIGNSDRWFGHNSFALGASLRHGRSPEEDADEKKNKNGNQQLIVPTSIRYAKPSEIRTVSSPRLAFIDQGSAFYGRSGPEMNPFTKNTGPFCRFKKSTVENFLSVVPASSSSSSIEEEEARPAGRSKRHKDSAHHDQNPIVAKLVKSRLPKGVFYLSTNSLLKAAGQRAEKIAAHMRECLANFSAADVMYF